MKILSSPEFKVGFLVVAVLGLIGVMAMKVSEDPSYLRGGSYRLWFVVDDSTGLLKNGVVKMSGVTVGVIKNIDLLGKEAKVEIAVDNDLPLTNSAAVKIRSVGLLGDKFVELLPGDPKDPPIVDGQQILVVSDYFSMEETMVEIGRAADAFAELSATIKNGMEDRSHPLGRALANFGSMTGRISEVVEENRRQLADILRKINEGEGTLGRLINDDTLAEEVTSAAEGINSLLETSRKIETAFDFHSELLSDIGESKSYVGIRLQPGLDRYYELAVVDDPKGVVERVDETVTGGGATTETQTVTRYHNDLKFTALFAKNFYDFTVKGGFIESRGGVGLDYYLLNRRLRLSVETFDFADLHMRAFARYEIWKGLYLIGGGDDIAQSDHFSVFVGAGLFLTNDDLKFLLTNAPVP